MYVKCYQTDFCCGQIRLNLMTSADICRGSKWGLIFFAKLWAENTEKLLSSLVDKRCEISNLSLIRDMEEIILLEEALSSIPILLT